MTSSAIAADAVMAFHFAFIVFALCGSFLILRWPKVIWLHLPALAWGAYIELSGEICPLTPLENHFRELAGEGSYYGGFITHYLGPIIYPANLTRGGQYLAFAILVAFNVTGYALVWRQRRRLRRSSVAL
ncbi:MAG TPA: DUF2784 domain-containing protein [Steroidobacteraceae bacterium]